MGASFSVIIPVYNTEKYLHKCIDSVLKQTYKEYEIIIVNDGSTDSSAEILCSYEKSCSCIRVVTQTNKGLGGARNTGIAMAKGDYLVFLDSDDYIREDMLEVLGQTLETKDLDVIAFDAYMVDLNGTVHSICSARQYSESCVNLSGKDLLMMEPTSCFKVYKRELFQEKKICFPEKLWYEDFATIPRMALHVKKMAYIKEPLYFYLQNPNSITHSKYTARMMEIMAAFDYVVNYYTEEKRFDEYYEELEWNCFLHVLYYSSFRLLSNAYHIKEMRKLQSYCSNLFAGYRHNIYVQQYKSERYLMKYIVDQQYFRFYSSIRKEKIYSKIAIVLKRMLH